MRHAPDRVVIVGASVAGIGVARSLRAHRYGGEVVILGAEAEWPYDKPPLSKELLLGVSDAERIRLLSPEQADNLSLDIRLGSAAERLRLADRVVVLADGTELTYAYCVVATGAAPRPLPWPRHPRIHALRTLADAVGIREALFNCGSVAIVGGGFIGAEVASAAVAMGLGVTIIDPLQTPGQPALGEVAARIAAECAIARGARLRTGVAVEQIENLGHGVALTLSDATTVRAGAAVVGIGAAPTDGWLRASGLMTADGLVCDRFCRSVTSDHVYAAGDVARWWHRDTQALTRVEHWTNAVDQAACVARNICHPDDPEAYRPVPYVWTEQYGTRFQIIGSPAVASRFQRVGQLHSEPRRGAIVGSDDDGHVRGAVTVNWPKALLSCRAALKDDRHSGLLVQELAASSPGAVAQKPDPRAHQSPEDGVEPGESYA